MRLIDADRLLTRLRKDPLFCLVEPYGIIGVIEAERIVDAVPFSFLEKLRDNAQNEEAALMIDEIIAQWRNKDEAN